MKQTEEERLKEWHDNYGLPTSVTLKEIQDAGFKPIGITIMMMEETFIFKTSQEADKAAELFMPEGWWYGVVDFVKARTDYIAQFYNGRDEDTPIIHWFDNNYKKIN